MNQVKTVKVAPGARRLIQSLTDMGYDLPTAIADLVDNSINADAAEIYVEIMQETEMAPAHIVIMDDGRGMNSIELQEAMRFGTEREYSIEELGKYGLGLKTASLSQCRTMTVVTKTRQEQGRRSRLSIAQWDLDHIDATNDWHLRLPEPEQLPHWQQQFVEKRLKNGGTIVIWTDFSKSIPLLETEDVRRREKEAARLADASSEHLRMVFHRFMEGQVIDSRMVRIYVNECQLIPWDPFCKKEKTTALGIVDDFDIPTTITDSKTNRSKITIKPYILPRQKEFSSQEAFRDAAGPKNWNDQQGFYFYRNNRLVQAGGWSNIRSRDEHIKGLRIAVDFDSSLDDFFGINITKMRARIPAEIRESLKNNVARWAKVAREHYDNKNLSSIEPSDEATNSPHTENLHKHKIEVTQKHKEEDDDGGEFKKTEITYGTLTFTLGDQFSHHLGIQKERNGLKIIVPHNHVCAQLFRTRKSKIDAGIMSLMLYALIEATAQYQVVPEDLPVKSLKKYVGKLK